MRPANCDLKIIELGRPRIKEWFVTAVPSSRGDPGRLVAVASRAAQEAGGIAVTEDVFGVVAGKPSRPASKAGRDKDGSPDGARTRLEAGSSPAPGIGGVQLHAVGGATVERIEQDGRTVGSVFDDGYARHCCLGDVRPPNASANRDRQARATFERMEAALRSVGMDFSNVVRTWFYLDHILDWYGAFNRVRDEFFREKKVFDGLVPASTGIGGSNPARTALIAKLYAIQPHARTVKIAAVPSPLQCPALGYGSSFSRAVELNAPDHRRLWISGTASIDPHGQTAHVGDLAGQVGLTMRVVAAILESRGLDWTDATRAVVYIKEKSGAGVFLDYCAAHRLPHLPSVILESAICRKDLLFEIELDACRRRRRKRA